MTIATIFERLKGRRPARKSDAAMISSLSFRDWADLPAHHPRKD